LFESMECWSTWLRVGKIQYFTHTCTRPAHAQLLVGCPHSASLSHSLENEDEIEPDALSSGDTWPLSPVLMSLPSLAQHSSRWNPKLGSGLGA
jgi:hypothetical protein